MRLVVLRFNMSSETVWKHESINVVISVDLLLITCMRSRLNELLKPIRLQIFPSAIGCMTAYISAFSDYYSVFRYLSYVRCQNHAKEMPKFNFCRYITEQNSSRNVFCDSSRCRIKKAKSDIILSINLVDTVSHGLGYVLVVSKYSRINGPCHTAK